MAKKIKRQKSKRPKKNPWKNRIVGHDEVDPQKLKPHPKNWREHPEHQDQALVAMLEKLGWVQEIIVNSRTGNMVDGHERRKLAIENGETSVPVKYIDVSKADELLILAALDPLGDLAGKRQDILDGIIGRTRLHKREIILSGFLATLTSRRRAALSLPGGDGKRQSPGAAALGLRTSNVRMVQLFMNQETIGPFLEDVGALKSEYALDNVTDTVVEACRRARASTKAPSR